jgi:hypothetical protein
LLLVVGSALSLGMARADNFGLNFSNLLGPGDPIVGTGTFSFSENLGDGTYLLSSVTNVQFDFRIAAETFTTANVDTINAPYVKAVVDDNESSFYFDTSGPDYGPYGWCWTSQTVRAIRVNRTQLRRGSSIGRVHRGGSR